MADTKEQSDQKHEGDSKKEEKDAKPAGSKAGTQPASQPANRDKPTVERTLHYGIVGDGELKEVKRHVPVDEPPQLLPNAQLKSIGKSVKRLDAVAKVTGKARYTFDVKLPGMLWGKRVVSPHAHAKVKSVDTSAAENLPGVKAVHVLERNLQTAMLRDESAEKPTYPVVRYAGQPVAAVAAISRRIAEAAARLVRVEYEPMPNVSEIEDAMRPDAPLVFPGPVEQASTAGGGGAPKGLPQRETCAARTSPSAARSPRATCNKVSPRRTSSSAARSARRSRRTRRWRRTASSPTGPPPASRSTPARSSPTASATRRPSISSCPRARSA